MVLKTPRHGHFCQIVLFLYYSAGKLKNETPIFFTIDIGKRPRVAAFGSGPRPLLGSAKGLRPVLKKELVRLSTKKNGRACQRWD